MTEIIDAWMQLPNKAYLLDPMFDSLRRWPTAWRTLAQDNPDIRTTRRSRHSASRVSRGLLQARGGGRPGQ